MSNLLNISSSPHVRDKSSTRSIMWDDFCLDTDEYIWHLQFWYSGSSFDCCLYCNLPFVRVNMAEMYEIAAYR